MLLKARVSLKNSCKEEIIIHVDKYPFGVSFLRVEDQKPRQSNIRVSHLREFLQFLLNEPSELYFHVIRWQDRFEGIFKIVDTVKLAQLWGKNRNLPGMTYETLSRSLRNYYKTNKMKKVPGQRQVYQFIFSEKNPPQMNPQIGHLIEQCNQLEKKLLFRKGLDLIPQSQTIKSAGVQKSDKASQRDTKRKQEIKFISPAETDSSEIFLVDPIIDITEEFSN